MFLRTQEEDRDNHKEAGHRIKRGDIRQFQGKIRETSRCTKDLENEQKSFFYFPVFFIFSTYALNN